MKKVQRYTLDSSGMNENPSGEWVRWEDVKNRFADQIPCPNSPSEFNIHIWSVPKDRWLYVCTQCKATHPNDPEKE